MNKTLQFPQDFFFGIADADLQVIGEKIARHHEDSLESMWCYFSKHSKVVHNNDTPEIGINRYEFWEHDLELMRNLGVTHYRTSVSMSRILKINGDINTKSVEWYAKYFKAIKRLGIKIYATLYHWELPQFLEEKGGWKNRKTIDWFIKHSGYVYEHLGEYIDEYFILNEPRCSSLVAYYYGQHAPGGNSLSDALLAAHHLLLGQGLVFEMLKKKNNLLRLATAINVGIRYSASPEKKDRDAAKIVDGHKNRWFLDPIFIGKYPEDMVEIYKKHMPEISTGDMDSICIGSKLSALGVNYYRGDLVKGNRDKLLGFETFIHDNGPKSDLGWGIFVPPYYQEGLYDVLCYVYDSYKQYGLKDLYITENGIAVKSDTKTNTQIIQDTKRIDFYRNHLGMVYKALLRGIPIKGYFPWTFMDNYEWQEGYASNSSFGLVHVNRETLQRTPKASYYWYKKVAETRNLEV